MPGIDPLGERTDEVNEEGAVMDGGASFFQQQQQQQQQQPQQQQPQPQEDGLRRHNIMDRPEPSDTSYLSSPLAEGFPRVLRDTIARNLQRSLNEQAEEDDNDNDDDDEDEVEGHEVEGDEEKNGAYVVSDSHNFDPESRDLGPTVDAPLVRWVHPYPGRVEAEAVRHNTARSHISRRQYEGSTEGVRIRVPLSLIANYIQNGGRWRNVVGRKCHFPDCVRPEDEEEEGARWYHPHHLNEDGTTNEDRTSFARSLILQSKHRQPKSVMLQPIFVLMPLTVNKS